MISSCLVSRYIVGGVVRMVSTRFVSRPTVRSGMSVGGTPPPMRRKAIIRWWVRQTYSPYRGTHGPRWVQGRRRRQGRWWKTCGRVGSNAAGGKESQEDLCSQRGKGERRQGYRRRRGCQGRRRIAAQASLPNLWERSPAHAVAATPLSGN